MVSLTLADRGYSAELQIGGLDPIDTPRRRGGRGMNIKTPAHQRDIYDWIAAHLPGAPAHYKYKYCQNGPETLASIAKSMSGRIIMASQVIISGGLTWREIARFNYGTDDPGEINNYLKWFNGCQRADPSGRNYRLDAGDKMPFVYLPAVALAAASTVNVIPAQPVTVQTPPPATELTQTALRRFDDLDGSKSGHIQRSDIRKALADKSFAGVEGAMLSTLYQHFGKSWPWEPPSTRPTRRLRSTRSGRT